MANNQGAVPLAADRFADQAARAKSVINGPLLLMVAAYPLVVGFSITKRCAAMSVVSGKPPSPAHAHAPDMWMTNDGGSLATTVVSFAAVTLSYAFITGNLLIKRIPGAPAMSKKFFWIAPAAFYAVTMSYFITYTTFTRYGPGIAEWIIFSFFATALTCVTIFCLVEGVVKFGVAPAPA